jgi:hypothetical protein
VIAKNNQYSHGKLNNIWIFFKLTMLKL